MEQTAVLYRSYHREMVIPNPHKKDDSSCEQKAHLFVPGVELYL